MVVKQTDMFKLLPNEPLRVEEHLQSLQVISNA